MSFHPNDVARRGRQASVLLLIVIGFLAQRVLPNADPSQPAVGSSVRGKSSCAKSRCRRRAESSTIATVKIIAENAVGYSVSLLPEVRGLATRDAPAAERNDRAHAQTRSKQRFAGIGAIVRVRR